MTSATKPTPARRDNPLSRWLRLASPEERERVATKAGTSVSYVYQLAGAAREPKLGLGIRLAAAIHDEHVASDGRLPVVTAHDLAMIYAHEGL